MRRPLPLLVLAVSAACTTPALAQPDLTADHLQGTQPLEMAEPLDVVMVRGINYFAERELVDSPSRRPAKWNRDYSSVEAYEASVEPNRQRLREIIGAVDELTEQRRPASSMNGNADSLWRDFDGPFVLPMTWDVLEGTTGEGYLLVPETADLNAGVDRPITAGVVLIPDPDTTPEAICGLDASLPPRLQIARRLATSGCLVLVVCPVDRNDAFSGHPDVRYTNMPHREYVYRMAFEMGRHIIGYEVQNVRAAAQALRKSRDLFEVSGERDPDGDRFQIAVAGVGEGGLLALYAAAVEPEFDAVYVSGYFGKRELVWTEPIYRNIWSQLTEFGDADIASLIAPRPLIIEAASPPLVSGPPEPRDGRSRIAAPGRISTPALQDVKDEFATARGHYEELNSARQITLVETTAGVDAAGSDEALRALLNELGLDNLAAPGKPSSDPVDSASINEQRQRRQVRELVDYTQKLLHRSDKARDKRWANVDRSSVEACVTSLDAYRRDVYDNLIGRLPEPEMPLNPRTRKVIDEETHVGYEVVLDCYPAGDVERPIPEGANTAIPDTGSVDSIGWAVGEDWGVIAGGILLLPKDLKEGEQRPVVVCQHGLEGTPMDTIVTDPSAPGFPPYKGFSTQLVQRGFIVYVPQNPYRGRDAFRVIQRKSNPMGRSLFSYIIPQHARTLEWLASLPYVDPQRMAFYGLSYGGKTAVRVPPMLVPGRLRAEGQGLSESDPSALNPEPSTFPGYCLSICSADFDEWVLKNASSEDRYSYVYTGEYEIFEWNMGHVANYAELSYLMTPRPFMVERGHDDGVAPDEWVAWEFAKVKRHYVKLGIGDKAEIEYFDGPHTINGVGTFDFLHRHLDWRPESVFQPL